MNDPGLDEPIQDSAKVEDERKAEEQLEEEDEQTFLVPRYPLDMNPWNTPSDPPLQSLVGRVDGFSFDRGM